MIQFSGLNKTKRALAVVSGLAGAAALLTPAPAQAWWVRGCCAVAVVPPVVVAPPVVAGPPVVYAAPGPVYVAPRRFWVPGHYRGPYWIPGHWA